MNCYTANASGRCFRFTSLHFRSYTSFRHLSFHSVHCQPQPWQPTQECFLHSIMLIPNRRFISLPFGFPIPQSSTQSQNGKLHSTPHNSLLSIQSPHLLFPPLTSVCPTVEFAPENKNHKSPTTL